MNSHIQPSQAIEMSKTQEQNKQQAFANQSNSNQWMQGKIGKDMVNTSNTHIPQGPPHVHGGVIATMNRKNLAPNNPKGAQSVTQQPG